MSAFVQNSRPFLTHLSTIVPHPHPSCYHISCIWPSQSSAGNSISPALPCVPKLSLSLFPPPMSFSWSVLAQWCVSSNLSCPSKRNQDEMAGALGHQPQCYLNHQHLCLHNGRKVLRRSSGMEKKSYIQPGNTREKSSLRSCNQRGKSCINHDNTLRRQPPLHQWRETASQRGEGSSQCSWIK